MGHRSASLFFVMSYTILILDPSLMGKWKKYKRMILHEETDSSQLYIHIMS
jgi:hypothetical protein